MFAMNYQNRMKIAIEGKSKLSNHGLIIYGSVPKQESEEVLFGALFIYKITL